MKSVEYYFREGEIAPLYCFGETDTGKHFFLKNEDNDIEFGHFGSPVKVDWFKLFPESKSYFKVKLNESLDLFSQIKKNSTETAKSKGPLESEKLWGEQLIAIKKKVHLYEELIKRLSTPQIKQKLDSGAIINEALVQKVKSVPITNFIKFDRGMFATSIWNPTEKSPSMHYYSNNNKVRCFSSNTSGDVIDVVQQLYNLNFIDAVKYLSKYI